jgi:hypothetical protein
MKEVPVAHDLPKIPHHAGIIRKLNDKRWVLEQFELGVPEIAWVVGYKMRSTEVWRDLAVVMRDQQVHPTLGPVDEWIVLLPIDPVRLWLKRSQTNAVK